MSLSYFEKGTGLSRETITNAIHSLTAKGILFKEQAGNSFIYGINIDGFELVVGNSDQSEIPTKTVGDSDHLLVGDSDTIKKHIKETPKDSVGAAKSQIKDFESAWFAEYPKYHDGMKYLHGGAKDTEGTKRLLTIASPAELINLAVKAWKSPSGWNCRNSTASIRNFASKINEIRAELTALSSPPPKVETYKSIQHTGGNY